MRGARGWAILLIMPYCFSSLWANINAVMMRNILTQSDRVLLNHTSSTDCRVADSGDVIGCDSVIRDEFNDSGSIVLRRMAPMMLKDSRMMAVCHIGVPERR